MSNRRAKLTLGTLASVACLAVVTAGLAVSTGCNVVSAANCSTNSETGADRGPEMAPGTDCMNCHQGGRGGGFKIAGTVMGAYKDAEQCDGVSGVTVTITDAAGKTLTLDSNSVGNFYTEATFTAPYTAKVSRNGKELAMQTPQTDGACGSCHTDTGANGAPGRVIAP